MKRYDYPRWMFVNSSDDIIDLCTHALDAARHRLASTALEDCIAVSRAETCVGSTR